MNSGGNRQLIIGILIGLILGVLLGMLLFWGPFKVEYTGGYSYDLVPEEKARHMMLVSDSYALDQDIQRAQSFLAGWGTEEMQVAINDALLLAEAEGKPEKVQQLNDLSVALGLGAPATPAVATPVPPPPPETGVRTPFERIRDGCIIALLVFVALIILYLIVRTLIRRRPEEVPPVDAPPLDGSSPIAAPPVAPVAERRGVGPMQLGSFITTYKLGENTYDESFSIETPAGEFLGECGVGISETIGQGDPDKVTAFEVWLFDKSDIRTVTKVLMSDHAYHDDTLRAKLAPKGDAVLATAGVPFLLETTGLQVQVTATDLDYGEGALPPKSFFSQLTIQLVARARSATA